MSAHRHSELHEDFLLKPSKVDDVIKLLNEIAKSSKDKTEMDISAGVTDTSFMVLKRIETGERRKSSIRRSNLKRTNTNQFTFMRQINVSEEERHKVRIERMSVANSFRRLGNLEYRKLNYDKAIDYYSKGLNYIVDSPVLYVNRSLCNIKKREYKRALLDLDHVLNNLDEICLRALLYKAGTLKRMNNETGFEQYVQTARRYHRSELTYIDYFLDKMRSDF
ncbi:LOW QUALITY PROTEIN: tetratricopeptide repeat protein 12-like [Drosophila sulfurigaster albostrigata]|uniref:LOW QUALITY PROTEIN: tetratricopeptide repeat protein 12-like n=1 Tax=Drosophila sulfurigaster albostrigata TaxID=89887 RepID=UPI002D21A91D|nr:LOW QUALITY PROTEIN: tetratricopeptide repeat protein 12-like [Drosophila sulfurigaster albostrigata]